jgi:hypothetical protein
LVRLSLALIGDVLRSRAIHYVLEDKRIGGIIGLSRHKIEILGDEFKVAVRSNGTDSVAHIRMAGGPDADLVIYFGDITETRSSISTGFRGIIVDEGLKIAVDLPIFIQGSGFVDVRLSFGTSNSGDQRNGCHPFVH